MNGVSHPPQRSVLICKSTLSNIRSDTYGATTASTTTYLTDLVNMSVTKEVQFIPITLLSPLAKDSYIKSWNKISPQLNTKTASEKKHSHYSATDTKLTSADRMKEPSWSTTASSALLNWMYAMDCQLHYFQSQNKGATRITSTRRTSWHLFED